MDNVVTLAEVVKGQRGMVMALTGCGDFQERVVSMGIFPGCEIIVLEGDGKGGRMLVAAGDTRIALGHGMAGKVLVAVDP